MGRESADAAAAMQGQPWVPIHNCWRWADPDTEEMKLTVVVLLPSGVGDSENDVHVTLECESTTLSIQVRWPATFNCSELLHKKWLKGPGAPSVQAYHPRILGYKRLLDSIDKQPNGDRVSVARIQLPGPSGGQLCETEMMGIKGKPDRYLYVSILLPTERKRNVSKPISLTLL